MIHDFKESLSSRVIEVQNARVRAPQKPKGRRMCPTLNGNRSFADQTVDRLHQHLADLQQRYDTNQQEKTNKRLAVLTVISAIFLPLTLLAGIYGMNFDVMPELHVPYAYPVALGVMAIIAVGLYRYFRSNGWLDWRVPSQLVPADTITSAGPETRRRNKKRAPQT
jgi:Mg2+ and Co2+ transporter CorA